MIPEKIEEFLIRSGSLGFLDADRCLFACCQERDDLCGAVVVVDGKLLDHIAASLKMHGNQNPRLEVHQKITGTGIVHSALTRIKRKEGNVNHGLSLNERIQTVVKILFGGFDFHNGGFIAPVPEIEISGMKQGDA